MLGRRAEWQMPWFSCLRWTLVRILLVNHSHVAIHINEDGLSSINMQELANRKLELMDQTVFKWIQFLCDYFGCKLSGWPGQNKGALSPNSMAFFLTVERYPLVLIKVHIFLNEDKCVVLIEERIILRQHSHNLIIIFK